MFAPNPSMDWYVIPPSKVTVAARNVCNTDIVRNIIIHFIIAFFADLDRAWMAPTFLVTSMLSTYCCELLLPSGGHAALIKIKTGFTNPDFDACERWQRCA